MLAWTEAPYWEGLSYPSGGALCRPLWQDKYFSAMWSDMWKPRVHYSWGNWGDGMVRDGQLQKTRIYPPRSDAIEHKFVKTLIYHKLLLPAGKSSLLTGSLINFL